MEISVVHSFLLSSDAYWQWERGVHAANASARGARQQRSLGGAACYLKMATFAAWQRPCEIGGAMGESASICAVRSMSRLAMII